MFSAIKLFILSLCTVSVVIGHASTPEEDDTQLIAIVAGQRITLDDIREPSDWQETQGERNKQLEALRENLKNIIQKIVHQMAVQNIEVAEQEIRHRVDRVFKKFTKKELSELIQEGQATVKALKLVVEKDRDPNEVYENVLKDHMPLSQWNQYLEKYDTVSKIHEFENEEIPANINELKDRQKEYFRDKIARRKLQEQEKRADFWQSRIHKTDIQIVDERFKGIVTELIQDLHDQPTEQQQPLQRLEERRQKRVKKKSREVQEKKDKSP